MKMSAQRETGLIRKDIKVLEVHRRLCPPYCGERGTVGAEEFQALSFNLRRK